MLIARSMQNRLADFLFMAARIARTSSCSISSGCGPRTSALPRDRFCVSDAQRELFSPGLCGFSFSLIKQMSIISHASLNGRYSDWQIGRNARIGALVALARELLPAISNSSPETVSEYGRAKGLPAREKEREREKRLL